MTQDWNPANATAVKIGYDLPLVTRKLPAQEYRADDFRASWARDERIPSLDLRKAQRIRNFSLDFPMGTLAKRLALIAFVVIAAVQVLTYNDTTFHPHRVPITSVYSDECGEAQINQVVLESPSVAGTADIYEVYCSNGERLADWQRPGT